MTYADSPSTRSGLHDHHPRSGAAEALRTSGNHTVVEPIFQALIEAAPDAIIIIEESGRVALANAQAERMFGYTRDALVGQPVEQLLPERFRARHEVHRHRYVSEPRTRPMGHGGMELVALRSDHIEFPVEISLSPLHLGDGLLVTSVIRDITDRKRAAAELERQVRERTQHLDTVLAFGKALLRVHSLDDVLRQALSHALALVPEAQRGAIYLVDSDSGRLAMRASTGFQRLPQMVIPSHVGLIGLAFTTRQTQIVASADELMALVPQPSDGQPWWQQFGVAESTPTGEAAVPLLAHNNIVGVLLLVREQQRGPFAAESRTTLEGIANLAAIAILEEESRRAAAALTSQLAMAEERQRETREQLTDAEASLLQAARLSAVGQLAAAVAHEINNPLYATRNALYLHTEDLPADLKESPFLQMATEQLGRIAGIVARMREFYRPPREEQEPADINQLLAATLELASLSIRHTAISIIFTPAPDLPRVTCHADQLRQVFLNLILNAIEAMPEGGTLTLRTDGGPTVALIEIRDTGVGIPDAVRARLFEPFFTTKATGTGLGLSVSAHIVAQHGGEITVDSAPGEGTTFHISLPYQPKG